MADMTTYKICQEYYGDTFDKETVENSTYCIMGEYLTGPCPTAGCEGTCVIYLEELDYTTTELLDGRSDAHYYSDDPNFVTGLRSGCEMTEGTWYGGC